MSPAEALLDVRDLRVAYRGHGIETIAVDGVSLSIGRGEAVGIVGESGSGKSTFARSLLALLPSGAGSIIGGEVRVENQLVPVDRLEQLRGRFAAMVFQDPLSYLNPLMTVGTQIAEAVRLHEKDANRRERVEELLSQVRLAPGTRHSYPHEISGGMRQRALLAIALACRPKLLIADEPTTALDVTTQKEILNLLRELRAQLQMSLLLISHDLGVVGTMCDRIHVMYRGKVVEQGPTARIFSAPQEMYSKVLLNAAKGLKDENGRYVTLQADADTAVAPLPKVVVPVRPRVEGVVLELRDIGKTFRRRGGGEVKAAKGVNLQVRTGQTVALVGESGSGKSTLARIALGLLAPDGGQVLLDGEDIYAMPPAELRRKRIAMQPVFQDASAAFNPRRTVFQALEQAMQTTGEATYERLAQLLEHVGIRPGRSYLTRFPHELSGGQRQRVAIARAIAMEPSLIIADEPLSGADVSIRGQILNLLKDLQAIHHMAYLFVTHDISLARSFADWVAVMYHGELVEQGPAEQVIASPRHVDTRRLVSAAIHLDALGGNEPAQEHLLA